MIPNTVIRFSLLAVVYHPIAEKGSDSRHYGPEFCYC